MVSLSALKKHINMANILFLMGIKGGLEEKFKVIQSYYEAQFGKSTMAATFRRLIEEKYSDLARITAQK